ncbi:hypothetical protein J7E91_18900 [Streptomyces sp. ISL-99]|uniref:hypothetical protein n=1 Tax=Streptomyces sp. ISL-99 TaxID=2819193 RepID=UPI001BEB9A2C|nr:hypothetical protein [Streptomyces sp. ISL-99]MBT2527435.1 hypothetical protein [Streptomyces sp. ISL-99]
MPDWFKRKAARRECELAWAAMLAVATRVPFCDTTAHQDSGTHVGQAVYDSPADPDTFVGQAAYDSAAVHRALEALAARVGPHSPLLPALIEAQAAIAGLLALRPSWIDYRNTAACVDPDADDAFSEMSRQYTKGDAVRAWPRFADGKAAYDRATRAARRLQTELEGLAGRTLAAPRMAA